MNSAVPKRSIVIGGRATSVSLEDEFWKGLREIAHERRETLSQLVTSIDGSREAANLSSALRVAVLEFYKDRSAPQHEAFPQREIPVQ